MFRVLFEKCICIEELLFLMRLPGKPSASVLKLQNLNFMKLVFKVLKGLRKSLRQVGRLKLLQIQHKDPRMIVGIGNIFFLFSESKQRLSSYGNI